MSISDEYKALRDEILMEYQREVNLSAFVFPATALLITYGITTNNPLLFLVPLPLLALLLRQFMNSLNSVLTISVYIRVFIESNIDNDQQWETAIDALRDKLRIEKRFKSLTDTIFAKVTAWFGIVCLCLSLISIFSDHDPVPSVSQYQLWIIALIVAAILWLTLWAGILGDLRKADSGEYEKALKKDLEEIYDRLRQHKEGPTKIVLPFEGIMNSTLVEYLTWFKENEKGMNSGNNLASSAVHEPENAILEFMKSQEFSNRLNLHDPWWHPALLEYLRQQYHIADGRELVITNGASGAIWLVFQALMSPGDHVIVESPVYQPLLSVPKFFNAEISLLERKAEKNYEIDKKSLESLIRHNTKLIVLSNLHNPSGYPLGPGVMKWLKRIVKESRGKIKVLIDETFRDLASEKSDSAANFDESFISINTLSKAYGLATLRCGWIISSQETYAKIRDTYVLVENAGSRLTESLSSMVVERLDSYRQRSLAICSENHKILRAFMDPLIAEKRIFGQIPTNGCLYFPRIAGMEDTNNFARELRDSWNVYVAPGHFFRAPQHIRIGFGGDAEHLPATLNRLTEAIRSRTTLAT